MHAIRRGAALELWVDGKRVATSAEFEPKDFDLNASQPLRIGSGASDFFNGHIRNVKLYRRALSYEELQAKGA